MTPIPCLKFDAELDAALNVQERIFPTARPVVPGLDYFGDWRPAHGVGGDYIDYFEMNDGNLGVAVGDVCGKGVPAALLTSSLHSMIRGLRCAQRFRLKTLVQTIDKLFCEICPDNCYATLFVGEYDPSSGQLHYVNAGHEPPFVLRKQGRLFQTVFLEATGPMIGMLRPATYREGTVTLRPGDLLVAYTDGLCDTTSRVGEEWGWQRFLEDGGGLLRPKGPGHRGGCDASGGSIRGRRAPARRCHAVRGTGSESRGYQTLPGGGTGGGAAWEAADQEQQNAPHVAA